LAQKIVENPGQLELLALDPEWMPGRVGNLGKIELRDQAVRFGAVLELRRLQPLCDQRRGGTKLIEHVECRRMERRGARFLAEAWARLEHRHRYAGAHQPRRRDHADRAGAGDQHPVVGHAAIG